MLKEFWKASIINAYETNNKRTQRRFKLPLSEENILFHGIVAAEMMCLAVEMTRKASVIRIIDTQSHFQIQIFSKSQSTLHIWDIFIAA